MNLPQIYRISNRIWKTIEIVLIMALIPFVIYHLINNPEIRIWCETPIGEQSTLSCILIVYIIGVITTSSK